MEILLGFVLVIMAGLGIGTTAWPFKKLKDLHFEQYLFMYILTGIVIFPWIVVLLNVPDLASVVRTVGIEPLLTSNLLSMSWGIANVLYLVCVVKIGAAMSGAVLSALGMSIGIVMPMIIKGSGSFSNAPDLLSKAGILIIIGILIIVAGIVLLSIAGFKREKVLNSEDQIIKTGRPSGKFLEGLILVILAGILSCGLSLAFVYSQGPVIEAVKQQGAGEITANITVWALGALGGALINILYAVYLMTRKGTWGLLFSRKEELLYGSLSGLQFIVSIVLFGRGMVFLGVLGASVGFGIQQSMQIAGNQIVGFVGGEWKGVNGKPRKIMYLGLAVILIAVFVFSYSNTIS
jgi:L-rhamnose-H+ transport protein